MADYRIEITKDWVDYIVAFTPLLGIIFTLYIAWLQHKLAQAQQQISKRNTEIDARNLRFVLYKDRKKVYDDIKSAFHNYYQEGTILDSVFWKFKQDTRDIEFLLGKDVQEIADRLVGLFANKMRIRSELYSENGMPTGISNEERRKVIEEEGEIDKCLDEIWKELPSLFAKYLKIN